MKKILWLSSWYPNRLDPLLGDFIERHARAAALKNEIFLLHVLKDSWPLTGVTVESRQYPENLSAKIIYYRHKPLRVKWLDTLLSNLRYFLAHRKAVRSYIKENGQPEYIHVHIALKAGLIARYYQLTRGISYMVSEQWTGICSDAIPNISNRSWLFRLCWNMVMRHASGYSAVSRYLLGEMQQRFGLVGGRVIPNVVDGKLFHPASKGNTEALFCHISTLKYQKNPEQIFQAVAILKERGHAFRLAVIGPEVAALRSLADTLQISDNIEFRGLMTHDAIAAFIRTTRALILYSRFETFGCVLIEANASGIPVIASDIPVIRENVSDGVNGWLIPLDHPDKLADALEKMLTGNHFSPHQLQAVTESKFSFERIGNLFDDMYRG